MCVSIIILPFDMVAHCQAVTRVRILTASPSNPSWSCHMPTGAPWRPLWSYVKLTGFTIPYTNLCLWTDTCQYSSKDCLSHACFPCILRNRFGMQWILSAGRLSLLGHVYLQKVWSCCLFLARAGFTVKASHLFLGKQIPFMIGEETRLMGQFVFRAAWKMNTAIRFH